MVVRMLTGAAIAVAAVTIPASAALAQAYPGNNDRAPGEVEGLQESRGGGQVDGAQVKGVTLVRGETLSVTGVDSLQLAVLGGGLVLGGAVMVKRSRRQPSSTSA